MGGDATIYVYVANKKEGDVLSFKTSTATICDVDEELGGVGV